jgi:hypothetical protein
MPGSRLSPPETIASKTTFSTGFVSIFDACSTAVLVAKTSASASLAHAAVPVYAFRDGTPGGPLRRLL